MNIRQATVADTEAVRAVTLAAFDEAEAGVVSQVAVDLLGEESSPPILTLVADVDGAVVGFVSYSPLTSADTGAVVAAVLAPLAVQPEHQQQGIARHLIEQGCDQLARRGVDVLLVYGDPAFYGRFGFTRDVAERYVPPYPLTMPEGWQGLVLPGGTAATTSVRVQCARSLCDASLW